MRSSTAARVALAGLAAMASACGGNANGGGGAPIPFADLGAEFATVYCHKLFACCDAAERSDLALNTGDEVTCRELLGPVVSETFAENAPGIEAGRIVYHGEKVRRCLDWLAALPCAQWGGDDELSRSADCREIMQGTVAADATCTADADCVGGDCVLGTCGVPLPKLNESCTRSNCAAGLVCDSGGLGPPTVCSEPRPDGAQCNGGLECASRYCSAPNGVEPRFCGPPVICNGV